MKANNLNNGDFISVGEATDSILPVGWNSAFLGDILLQRKGKKPKRLEGAKWDGSVPYIDIEAFETGRIRKYADPESSVIVEEGDVVIVWDGARCGHVGKAPERGALGSTLMTLASTSLREGYLLRFLQLLYETINSNPRGTGIPHVDPELFWNLEMPLAPVVEQKRIVAKIEKLLPKVNAVRERLIRVKVIMKRFRQSVLSTACSGRLTEEWRKCNSIPSENKANQSYAVRNGLNNEEDTLLPPDWVRAAVNQVCSEIVDCPHSTPKWAKDGEICIRTTNFRPGALDLSEVRYVSKATYEKRNERLKPMPGDVLYSREGGILGIACMIPEGVKVCLGQRMMLMRTDSTRFLPPFLMHVLNSPEIQRVVTELTGGSASPHLNVGGIKNFPVPVPSTTEQKVIVRRVEALFKLADKIEKRVEVELSRTEKMAQAILAKAFRGELLSSGADLSRREVALTNRVQNVLP
jgi:type I restriction enzyme, S subunit